MIRRIAREVAKRHMYKRGYRQVCKKSDGKRGKKHTSYFASEWRAHVH